MSYAVKTLYYTLQGEGLHAGRPAVLCRFAGCNLWSGREEDRSRAVCRFCDTDFVGTDGTRGGRYGTAEELTRAASVLWPEGARGRPYVVCTGGEPLLQLDQALVEAFHEGGFEVAIETNGTLRPPAGVDWICVSPKAGAELILREGDELKLVYPQSGIDPEELEGLDFQHFFLQPMDAPDLEEHTRRALQYCLEHPQWKLSLQVHKLLDIP